MFAVETIAARLFVVLATAAACSYGAHEIHLLLGTLGTSWIDAAVVVLFIICFGWVTFGSATALVGLYGIIFNRHMRAGPVPVGAKPKTALCMPIYHESPVSVCAHVMAMAEDLIARGEGKHFDVFLLSDSTRAGAWLAEEQAWVELQRRLAGRINVYYRKRRDNAAKKAGNLRDFCMRFGSDYKYLIVLDADSIMSAESMGELVNRMEGRPLAGLIQVPPIPVRRQTPFARLQQFAAAVYGPLWARGSSILWRGDGNYFGHNAIVRTEVFQQHCGLAPLSGRGAFAGLVLSHDFVEAALVRRAGYEVWLADDIAGSYEHCPTTLIDYAIRDRRWCQGNIQHLRVALAPGLHWSSRFHLFHGVMSYLAAPIWLAFVLLGLLAAAHDQSIDPVYFPRAQRTLFPQWPVFDYAAAYALLWLSVAVLFGPRLIAMVVFIVRQRFAAAVQTVFSTLLEFILSTLISPALMLFQTVFVLTTIFGEKVAWAAQERGDRSIAFKEAIVRHGIHVFAAAAMALMGFLISESTFLWQMPLAIGLLLSPLLSMITSSSWLGRWFARLGLLLTPVDRHPPEILNALDRFEAERADEVIDPVVALSNPSVMKLHAQVAAITGMLVPLSDEQRTSLWEKRKRGEMLSNAEQLSLLRDPQTLMNAVRGQM